MQRLCPRCRHAVLLQDESALIYCGNCGAPQVRLSEELLDQVEAQRHEAATGLAEAARPHRPEPGAIDWKGAINCAILAGGISFLLALVALALPPVILLAYFWAIGAPIVTLGIYSARFRETLVRPSFGARLGVLSGIAVVLGMSLVNTAGLLLTRYAFHSSGDVDAHIAAMFLQVKASILQQPNTADALLLTHWLDIPEFRAGMLLSVMTVFVAFYLVFSALGGAFAGFLRARRSAS